MEKQKRAKCSLRRLLHRWWRFKKTNRLVVYNKANITPTETAFTQITVNLETMECDIQYVTNQITKKYKLHSEIYKNNIKII